MTAHEPLDHDRIERLAYAYWEERGRPEGSPERDWYRALAKLGARHADTVPLISSLSLEANEAPWR
jgi:hypothetical protein